MDRNVTIEDKPVTAAIAERPPHTTSPRPPAGRVRPDCDLPSPVC